MLQCQQREGLPRWCKVTPRVALVSWTGLLLLAPLLEGQRSISWAECRHEAIPTDGFCCGYSLCVVCSVSGQWCPLMTSEVSASPWFSTLPLTRFSSQSILKTSSQRDLLYSWTRQRAGEGRRVTMTIPSAPFSLQLEESGDTSQKNFGRPAKVCKYVKEGRKLCDRSCAWTKITCGQLVLWCFKVRELSE